LRESGWRLRGPYGSKLRNLTTAEDFLFCETGSFGKVSFSPAADMVSSGLAEIRLRMGERDGVMECLGV